MILSFSRLILSVFALGSLCALGNHSIVESAQVIETELTNLIKHFQSGGEIRSRLKVHQQALLQQLIEIEKQISLHDQTYIESANQIKKLVHFMLDFYPTVSEDVIEIAKQIARSEVRDLSTCPNLNNKIISKYSTNNLDSPYSFSFHPYFQSDINYLINFLKTTEEPAFLGREIKDLTRKDFIIIMYRYSKFSHRRFEILEKLRVSPHIILKLKYFKYPDKHPNGISGLINFLREVDPTSTILKADYFQWFPQNKHSYHTLSEVFNEIKSGEIELELSELAKANLQLIESSLHYNGQMLDDEQLFQSIPYLSMNQ
jgi:hypothetical protein